MSVVSCCYLQRMPVLMRHLLHVCVKKVDILDIATVAPNERKNCYLEHVIESKNVIYKYAKQSLLIYI